MTSSLPCAHGEPRQPGHGRPLVHSTRAPAPRNALRPTLPSPACAPSRPSPSPRTTASPRRRRTTPRSSTPRVRRSALLERHPLLPRSTTSRVDRRPRTCSSSPLLPTCLSARARQHPIRPPLSELGDRTVRPRQQGVHHPACGPSSGHRSSACPPACVHLPVLQPLPSSWRRARSASRPSWPSTGSSRSGRTRAGCSCSTLRRTCAACAAPRRLVRLAPVYPRVGQVGTDAALLAPQRKRRVL